MTLKEYASFAIPQVVEIAEGNGGFPVLRISNDFAEAEMYLYGAHVTRFDPKGAKPLLWMSPVSPFTAGKPIRGGIPLCFPWFGAHREKKEFPLHGFARIRPFELSYTARLSDGRTRVGMTQRSDDATRAWWPHEYSMEVTATFGEALEVSMTVTNTDREPFSYEDCMHTYFTVSDASNAVVRGLDGAGYLDRLAGDAAGVQSGNLTIGAGLTKVYTFSPRSVRIDDRAGGRVLLAEQSGMANTVVWNPGKETAAGNPEIAGKEKEFLCIEAANCAYSPVVLLPGCSHTSTVRYSTEK
jgi:D-hexose-6-phosphate mutarotase